MFKFIGKGLKIFAVIWMVIFSIASIALGVFVNDEIYSTELAVLVAICGIVCSFGFPLLFAGIGEIIDILKSINATERKIALNTQNGYHSEENYEGDNRNLCPNCKKEISGNEKFCVNCGCQLKN